MRIRKKSLEKWAGDLACYKCGKKAKEYEEISYIDTEGFLHEECLHPTRPSTRAGAVER